MSTSPRLRVNVLANAVGRFSSILLAVLCTPLYIHFLGIEAYGLIGFYITLQASLSFLEMGLSRACNRELARYSGQGEGAHQSMLDTLRSLEVIYWLVAILLGFVLTVASSWIASSWLDTNAFSNNDLEQLLVMMAWVIALRWPVGLYSGALMGLQRQVMLNSARVAISVLNWVGSVLVLWLVSPEVQLFFQWQLVVAMLSSVAFVLIAWRVMPGTYAEGNFSGRLLRSLIRFAAGVGGNAVFGTLLLQADKLILSAMLPLKQFAYYSLASVIANMISMLASPVSGAVFPRFSQLVGSHSPESQISALYHLACQSVSVLVVPLSLTVAFFSYQSLYVYTGSAEIASNTATILTVLIVAKMLHASMIVPYALQLAYGWVRLSLYVNMVSVLWLVPAVYLLSQIYGPVGAAAAWLLVSVGYLTIGIPLMHRRLLLGEQWSWMWRVLVAPVAVVCVFLELIQLLLDEALFGRWLSGILLVSISVGAVAVAVGSSPDVRKWVIGHLPGWRKA